MKPEITTRSVLLPNPIAPVRNVLSMMSKEFSSVRSLARKAFTRGRSKVAMKGSPEERFRATLAMNGRSEADLPAIEKAVGTRLELYVMGVLIALLWMALSPLLGLLGAGDAPHPLDFAYPVALVGFLSVHAFSASVSLYRIEKRAMVPVSAWWMDRKAWLGTGPSSGALALVVMLGSTLSLLLPTSAVAQASAVAAAEAAHSAGSAMAWLTSTLRAEDLSAEWLRRLFPGAMSLIGGSGQVGGDARAEMFGILNSVLLALGAAMLAYHTLIGTVSTAHEGKVLGNKWHTIWAPIRVVSGMGFLVPIRGYCIAQILVLQVIGGGYSLANQLWIAYARSSLSGEMAAVATSQNPMMGTRLAQAVAASETCAAVLTLFQEQIERHSSSAVTRLARSWNIVDTGIPAFATPTASGTPARGGVGGRTWSWGSACGQVVTTAGTPPASTTGAVAGGASRGGFAGGANAYRESTGLNAAYADFMRKRDEAVATLISAVRSAGLHEVLRDATAPNTRMTREDASREAAARYALILNAGEAFDRTVEEAAQEMVRTLNTREGEAIVRRAETLGWASAGSINATLVRATARAQEIVGSAAPSANGPDTTQLTRAISNSEARARMERAMRGVQELGRDILPVSGPGGRGVMQSVNLGADLAGNGVLSQVLAPVSHAITRAATDNIGYLDPVRPMASIQQTGTILTRIIHQG